MRHCVRISGQGGSRQKKVQAANPISIVVRIRDMNSLVSPTLRPWQSTLIDGALAPVVVRPLAGMKTAEQKPGTGGIPETVSSQMSVCLQRIGDSKDHAAFETVFRFFAPRVKAYLMRSVREPNASEELMQETMVQVWRKAVQYDPAKASASTWIFAIARNLRIDAYRKENRPEVDFNDPALVPEPERQPDHWVEGEQASVHIRTAMADLSSAEQAVLRLAYFEDKSQSMIAEQLQIPLGTVKSRLRLAFSKLRRALEPTLGDGR